MKKLFTALTILSALVLSSCGKEDSIETGGGGNSGGSGGTNNGALLLRNIAKFTPTDSTGYVYTYDNNRRLTTLKFVADLGSAGFKWFTTQTFTRNSNGIVTSLLSTMSDGTNSESINYNVKFDAATNRYTARVGKFMDNGQEVKDSTTFVFDAAGKVIREVNYYDRGNTGGYVEEAKTEFTYDAAGNVIKSVFMDFDASTNKYSTNTETTVTYDSKVNPVKLGNESFLLGLYDRYSNFNISTLSHKDFNDPGESQDVTFTYTYNNENKPAKAETTFFGMPVTYNYIYQ